MFTVNIHQFSRSFAHQEHINILFFQIFEIEMNSLMLFQFGFPRLNSLKLWNFLILFFLQVEELISNGHLNISSEEDVYIAVLNWVKHDLEERNRFIAKVKQPHRIFGNRKH